LLEIRASAGSSTLFEYLMNVNIILSFKSN